MKVISKIDTKKLIKGVTYEVSYLHNFNGMSSVISLVGISGSYSPKNFTDLNGNDVKKVNYRRYKNDNILNFKDIIKGDILVCESKSYKTLMEGGYYEVEEKEEKKSYNHSTIPGLRKMSMTKKYIKFVGINRKFIFNSYRFRKLSLDEKREFDLSKVLGEKSPDIIKTSNINKLDLMSDKDKFKTLIDTLCKSILDESRHELSILEWACKKTSDKINITKKDYKDILEMPLKDILNKIK